MLVWDTYISRVTAVVRGTNSSNSSAATHNRHQLDTPTWYGCYVWNLFLSFNHYYCCTYPGIVYLVPGNMYQYHSHRTYDITYFIDIHGSRVLPCDPAIEGVQPLWSTITYQYKYISTTAWCLYILLHCWAIASNRWCKRTCTTCPYARSPAVRGQSR